MMENVIRNRRARRREERRAEKRAEDVLHGFGIRGEETEDDAGVWEG